MANKYDIKSKNVLIGTAALAVGTDIDIGRVPAGKQRFVTYVKAAPIAYGGGATNTLYLGEYSAAQVMLATATTNSKLTIPFDSANLDSQDKQIPQGGIDVENPLFAIAQSQFLVGVSSRGNIDLFVQYYDD